MGEFAAIDRSTTPPGIVVPRDYNAAVDFIDRNLEEGRGEKIAVIDESGQHTYAQLADRVNQTGNALRDIGIQMEQRIAMCMLDTVDFPAVFFGSIKAGIVPVALNTLLTTADYDYMLRDSRAVALIVSDALLEKFRLILDSQPFLRTVIVAGRCENGEDAGFERLDTLRGAASDVLDAAATTCDDVAFWLYSSGSTGAPKGAVHLQSDAINTAELYGSQVLGITEEDIVFSAAKLFFAYGLGNAMTFPFHVGATTVLLAGRPTPESVLEQVRSHDVSIFYGVPTLFGAILADPDNDKTRSSTSLRICISAGEALPEDIAHRWVERFGVDILDGLGSTEMLHIFLSNAPSDISYGTSGKAVPGYDLKIVDEEGEEAVDGEIGELLVRGPSSASHYFNKRERSLDTFQGAWTRTGDKYIRRDDGYYVYCGRSDDMLKVSGQWVSPFEVESALLAHESVLETAVVGHRDDDELVKPKAFIILKEGVIANDAVADELKGFVKDRLAPFKYPRWIDFVDELPKTATGKIQRFKLRES